MRINEEQSERLKDFEFKINSKSLVNFENCNDKSNFDLNGIKSFSNFKILKTNQKESNENNNYNESKYSIENNFDLKNPKLNRFNNPSYDLELEKHKLKYNKKSIDSKKASIFEYEQPNHKKKLLSPLSQSSNKEKIP